MKKTGHKSIDLFDVSWHGDVAPGTEIVAIGTRDLHYLTSGKTYIAINGKEEGIFETRPFVTVVADDGLRHSMHLSRFTLSNRTTCYEED